MSEKQLKSPADGHDLEGRGPEAPGGREAGLNPAPPGSPESIRSEKEGFRLKKAGEKQRDEAQREIGGLRARPDYFPKLGYFLDLLEGGPAMAAERTGRPLAALLCVQAPLEIFRAFGLLPVKIFSGSFAASVLPAADLPALMCPLVRAAIGSLLIGGEKIFSVLAQPVACGWEAKFHLLAEKAGARLPEKTHRLAFPSFKEREGDGGLYLEELFRLEDFLIGCGFRRPSARELLNSAKAYNAARLGLARLAELRLLGKVALPWALAVGNSFLYDDPEVFSKRLWEALSVFEKREPDAQKKPVFLTGSPVFFPGWKIAGLMEEAGLNAAADDLCSSGRVTPPAVQVSDPSRLGIMKALAQHYHGGCSCPVFADGDRRVNAIISPARKRDCLGVVFHVLKGCHPYDIDGCLMEAPARGAGLKFLKVETDYGGEDSQNLLTRFEAFRSSL